MKKTKLFHWGMVLWTLAILLMLHGFSPTAAADDFVPQAGAIALGNPIIGGINGDLSGDFTFKSDGVLLDWNLTVTTPIASGTFTPGDSTAGTFCCFNGQTT